MISQQLPVEGLPHPRIFGQHQLVLNNECWMDRKGGVNQGRVGGSNEYLKNGV